MRLLHSDGAWPSVLDYHPRLVKAGGGATRPRRDNDGSTSSSSCAAQNPSMRPSTASSLDFSLGVTHTARLTTPRPITPSNAYIIKYSCRSPFDSEARALVCFTSRGQMVAVRQLYVLVASHLISCTWPIPTQNRAESSQSHLLPSSTLPELEQRLHSPRRTRPTSRSALPTWMDAAGGRLHLLQ